MQEEQNEDGIQEYLVLPKKFKLSVVPPALACGWLQEAGASPR